MLKRWAMVSLLAGFLVLPGAWAQGNPRRSVAKSAAHYVARWDVQNSGVKDELKGVCFVDANTGWAVGRNNTILKTTDGGQTWRRLTPPGKEAFESVVFASPTEGWVQGNELLHTTDGGETWRQAAPLDPHIVGFGEGAVVGSTRFNLPGRGLGDHLYRSDDGGATWQKLAGKFPHNDYVRVFFLDASHGWALRVGPDALLATDDGGQTWRASQADFYGRDPRLVFVSPTTGWALGRDATTILATTDGGKTWSRQTTGWKDYYSMNDLKFLDADHGYALAASQGGWVIATSDGGKHWRTLGSHFPNQQMWSLSFPDPEHGWVVGYGGLILHYHLVPAGQNKKGK